VVEGGVKVEAEDSEFDVEVLSEDEGNEDEESDEDADEVSDTL
jgi:hypothetical protein